MKTKIKYNKIKEASDILIEKSEEVDSIYKEIDSIIDSISSIWEGTDSANFINSAKEDIRKEKEKTNKLKKFGKNLDTISEDYILLDNSFEELIKRESIDNG